MVRFVVRVGLRLRLKTNNDVWSRVLDGQKEIREQVEYVTEMVRV